MISIYIDILSVLYDINEHTSNYKMTTTQYKYKNQRPKGMPFSSLFFWLCGDANYFR